MRYFRTWHSDGGAGVTTRKYTREGVVEAFGPELENGKVVALEELPSDVVDFEAALFYEVEP